MAMKHEDHATETPCIWALKAGRVVTRGEASLGEVQSIDEQQGLDGSPVGVGRLDASKLWVMAGMRRMRTHCERQSTTW